MSDLILKQDAARPDHVYAEGAAAVPLAGKPLERLQRVTQDYRDALRQSAHERERRCASLGAELFAWLDERAGWGAALLDSGQPQILQWQLAPGDDEPGRVLAAAPWEILADAAGCSGRRACRNR